MSNDLNRTLETLMTTLDQILVEASHTSVCAREAIKRDERNQAIGILLPIVEQLDAASALLRTILTLHRSDHGLAR